MGVAWLWDWSFRKLESYDVEFHFKLYLCVWCIHPPHTHTRTRVGWVRTAMPVCGRSVRTLGVLLHFLLRWGLSLNLELFSDVLSPLQPLPFWHP